MELDWFICPLKSQLNALGYRKCTWKTEINADDITLEILEKDPQDTDDSNRALGWSPGEPGNHLDIRSSREEVCLITRRQFRYAGFSVALLHQTLCPRLPEPGWQSVHQLVCILVQLSLHVQDRLSLFAPDIGPLSAPTRLVSSNELLLREQLVHILKNDIWWDSSEEVFDNLGPPDPFLWRKLSAEELMFWTVVLEKTLESPLDCKEIQPVHSKGDQPWDFFRRNDAKAEALVLWPPHAKSWLTGKDSDAGRDWGRGEGDDRGWDGWMASLTRWTWVWVNSRSWWWIGRPGVLRFMGLQRVGHDWATELNWTLSSFFVLSLCILYHFFTYNI